MKEFWNKIKEAVMISVAISLIGASGTSILTTFRLKKDVGTILETMVTKGQLKSFTEADRMWVRLASDSTANPYDVEHWRDRRNEVLTEK